jgi:ADP-ribosyl-[dinitrogen reductase] hydrolase
MPVSLIDHYRGCLLGLACGDAVGTTVEFSPRGGFPPVTDMVGGGPFQLEPGRWTDDTSMALCLATSLIHCGGFDARDQMNRYVNWWQWGYLSSTSDCFDIGMTVCRALQRYQVTGDPMAGSIDPATAGNGSLMRLAPVVLCCHPDQSAVLTHARLSSATTHAAPEALECCELLADLLTKALNGQPKTEVMTSSAARFTSPSVAAIALGAYLGKQSSQVTGSGYCVASLEAALWCFANTSSFEGAVLAAANLGDDADTTAAIVGQLAGAFYGTQGIPVHWLERLHMAGEVDRLVQALFELQPASLRPETLSKDASE